MNERLDILVVEDKRIHQEAAMELRNNHSVYIATNYYEAIGSLEERKFQVLMSDMKFPLGKQYGEDYPNGYAPTEDIFEERNLGYALALYASRPKIAVPKICILTDTNHHSDAISATFDDFIVRSKNGIWSEEFGFQGNYIRPAFKINKSDFVMFDSRDLPGLTGGIKNWKLALERLYEGPTKTSQLTVIEGA